MKERKMRTTKGIVSVAGKIVYIRHATEWDLNTIQNESRVRWQELASIAPERVVVAAEEDSIIGFGIVGKPSEEGAVSVTLFEKRNRGSIGPSIVRHVLANEPMIKALRESADLPDHAVKMVVSQKRRSSSISSGRRERAPRQKQER
jgi:hypothetical protein